MNLYTYICNQLMISYCIRIFMKDGQTCIDMVNVQQQGNSQVNANSQVVVPRSRFSCNGRLTGYLVSLNHDNAGDEYPHIEIWRLDRPFYVKISEYVLTEGDITEMNNYYFANVSFDTSEATQLQPGDFIGYYHPPSPRYTVWSVDTAGYVSYIISTRRLFGNLIATGILDSVNNTQPLIQILYGMIT